MDKEQLIETYFRYFEDRQQEDRWAWVEVDEVIRRDPTTGWELTCRLINHSESDGALAFIAAGPLEDLLNFHGDSVIALIEQECVSNARLRLALSAVWLDRGSPIWDRWYALMWKYGFAEGLREPL
jgi:hypothetical protein